MSCEDVELALLSGEPLSAEAQGHLTGCASCAQFSREVPQLLSDAAMPALSSVERMKLDTLAGAVQRAYAVPRPKRSAWRQVVSLGLAASVGALITSAVFKLQPVQAQTSERSDNAPLTALVADQTGFAEASSFEAVAAADESEDDSLEVSWPSINEGDVP